MRMTCDHLVKHLWYLSAGGCVRVYVCVGLCVCVCLLVCFVFVYDDARSLGKTLVVFARELVCICLFVSMTNFFFFSLLRLLCSV